MAAVALQPGYKALALKLQEQALMQGDVCARLRDAISDAFRGSGSYAYYIDHSGDGESGTVIYCVNGDMRQAEYEIGTVGGKASCAIDVENSVNVVPQTSYVPEADEADHYAAMGESFKASNLYTELPVYERFISKKTRDAMDPSDFAGKGTSFPIKTSGDVNAALRSLGRAGSDNYSIATIRANIKKIAKRKGFAIPDSLKDESDASESVSRETLGDFLIEFRLANIADANLKESIEYPIKLMSPGRGSSGFYPESVVKRDGPAIFKTGTQMFWNHATDTEEAERPEGNLDHLAAVLTSDATYEEAGHDGPGLYAKAKVFGPYVDKVREMGKHIGLSIRAGGSRDEAAVGPDGKRGVITALKNAQSVDFVTKAGRDGKIFTEAARGATEGDDMDKAEIQALIEAAVNPLKAENTRLQETIRTMQLRDTAPEIVHKALESMRLPAASKRKIFKKFTSATVASMLPLKEGALDADAIGKMIEAEAQRETAFLMELGLGDAIPGIGQRMTEAEIQADEKKAGEQYKENLNGLAELLVVGGTAEQRTRAKEAFVKGRAA